MSDLTNRLSKAVWEYLDTANLRSEPFSLSRIEEVIAGVMATEGKGSLRKAELHGGMRGDPFRIEALEERVEANRKRQADFMERYKALAVEPADAERAALEQYWATIRGRTV